MRMAHGRSFRLVLLLAVALAVGAHSAPGLAEGEEPSVLDFTSAEQYVKDFEFDVSTAEGKPFKIGYSGQEAMRRVKDLATRFPGNE